MAAPTETTGGAASAASLEALFREAVNAHAQPFWPVMESIAPTAPRPKAVPHVWRYNELRPYCERAARLVPAELAERRVFMLVNPALAAPHTTDTLYAGLQTILPGEVARAHRHTAFALRFIVEGDGAYTAVEGEKLPMRRGDLVLTPAWEWHDHGNEGDGTMIWLDGLDLPLWSAIPAFFMERYAAERYPAIPPQGASSRLYPWAEMQRALDENGGPVAVRRYRNRFDGGEIARAIGASAMRLAPGASTSLARETASSILHVYEGAGTSTIGDGVVHWQRGDTIAVPAWHTVRHTATSYEPAYLFSFDDRPLLDALGAYRRDDGEN
jgi:gentisate 1,2-dioxygenase